LHFIISEELKIKKNNGRRRRRRTTEANIKKYKK